MSTPSPLCLLIHFPHKVSRLVSPPMLLSCRFPEAADTIQHHRVRHNLQLSQLLQLHGTQHKAASVTFSVCQPQPLRKHTQVTHLPGLLPSLSCPSWPLVFKPQVYTSPSSSRNTEWFPPHATSLTFLSWMNPYTCGSGMMTWRLLPIPGCPKDE